MLFAVSWAHAESARKQLDAVARIAVVESPPASQLPAHPSGLPTPRQAPPVLYHWTNLDGLERWAEEIEKTGGFTVKKIYPGALIVLKYPELADAQGLFAWIHPLLGMGYTSSEFYGDVAVRLDIDPRARVLTLETQDGVKPPSTSFKGVDLVYHRRVYRLADGSYRIDWQEWIVCNPAAVIRFSADPRTLSADIKTRMSESSRYLSSNGFYDFPPEQLHAASFLFVLEEQFKHFVLERARTFMRLDPGRIPKVFRDSHD